MTENGLLREENDHLRAENNKLRQDYKNLSADNIRQQQKHYLEKACLYQLLQQNEKKDQDLPSSAELSAELSAEIDAIRAEHKQLHQSVQDHKLISTVESLIADVVLLRDENAKLRQIVLQTAGFYENLVQQYM